MTSLILTSDIYKLKYDANCNKLRDLTWDELKLTYGKGTKVICACSNREYTINSSFIASHQQSQKHKNWAYKELTDYVKEYGHSGDLENKVDTLYKQLREQKALYHNLAHTHNICVHNLEETDTTNKKLEFEVARLSESNTKYNTILCKKVHDYKILQSEFTNKNTEICILQTEIKELDKSKSYISIKPPKSVAKSQNKNKIYIRRYPFR